MILASLAEHTPTGYDFPMNTLNDQTAVPEIAVDTDRHSTSYANDKAKILARLRRIEGQVRGVARMVEDDKYCVDVLTQLSAAIAGLRATGLLVLEDHIRGCVINAEADDKEATLDELMSAIERFNRSVS
jgi:DNA-binding FrmR family transcriptional regulator